MMAVLTHWVVMPLCLPCVQVRVYVNGQLAGFTPIYYTMYTVSVKL
jgi:hypothetical protein